MTHENLMRPAKAYAEGFAEGLNSTELDRKNDELINCQDAMDEIARWIGYLDEDMIYRIQLGLKRLPSAEPEIIYCKDCKYYEPWDDNADNWCFAWGNTTAEFSYCSYAERREDG